MAGRPTTVRRVPEYLGPDKEIHRDDLVRYEREGGWVEEPKMDGMWCMMTVGGGENVLKSRDARTPAITGIEAGEFLHLPVPLPTGSIIVGELEAKSQWSTEQAAANGFRRLHVFDLIRLGDESFAHETWEQRRKRLDEVHADLFKGELLSTRLPLLPFWTKNFKANYDSVVADGIEGVVLKRRDSIGKSARTDGKTDQWLRCKKKVTDDFVLCGFAYTDGGKAGVARLTGRWGLYANGKLRDVMQAAAPEEYLIPSNVGVLVAEFEGWAQFASGCLRHAQFVRVRTDKTAAACVLKGKAR